jgi:hypothetical protein
MSRFISKEGIWFAAKEKVGLINYSGKTKIINGKEVAPLEPYIYEGPDRAALYELYQQKVETLGQNFRRDTEFLQSVRNMGFKDTEEYLAFIGYDKEKVEKDFKEKASVVNSGEMEARVKEVKMLGGGVDTTGSGQDRYGGFGPQPKD